MNIPESTLNEWLEVLKDKADMLYRDSTRNYGLPKEELFCEAEGVQSAVEYIVKKLVEMKNELARTTTASQRHS